MKKLLLISLFFNTCYLMAAAAKQSSSIASHQNTGQEKIYATLTPTGMRLLFVNQDMLKTLYKENGSLMIETGLAKKPEDNTPDARVKAKATDEEVSTFNKIQQRVEEKVQRYAQSSIKIDRNNKPRFRVNPLNNDFNIVYIVERQLNPDSWKLFSVKK